MDDFDALKNKTDAEIADLLKKEDSIAWDYVFANTALPVMKSYHISRILHDRHLSRLDVYGLLYEEMIGRGKINLYRGGSLLGWMKWYVWGLIHRYCKKNPWAMSEETSEIDSSDSYLEMSAPESKTEMLEIADLCFRELWQENQLRAYVHLLKLKYGLSAREIMGLLGLSSEENVNQLFSRALKDMKRLKRKYADE